MTSPIDKILGKLVPIPRKTKEPPVLPPVPVPELHDNVSVSLEEEKEHWEKVRDVWKAERDANNMGIDVKVSQGGKYPLTYYAKNAMYLGAGAGLLALAVKLLKGC